MAVKTFRVKILRGNTVEDGIRLEQGKYNCHCFDREEVLCYGTDPSVEEYFKAMVGKQGKQVFLRASDAEPVSDQELVLVHEYSPSSGGKRWPSFYIDWDNAGSVEKLISISRYLGSGADTWSLVIAPAGWADNIASQFIQEKDYPDQKIAYKPDFDPSKQFGDLPQDLYIAFGGDEGKVRKFMEKVAILPSDRLDDHIIHACGRGRVQAHLEEVSGDPDFFMDADPNRVVGYIAEVHFPKNNESWHEKADDSIGSLGYALKKAGL